MLFSIVIPVYNVEKYIEECLNNIIGQALEMRDECEIILVDDGSTDSSGEICDKYYWEYPNLIKVFHNTNHGLLYTRRFGYKQTSGEYIVNCDSDDKLEFNALLKFRDAIENNDRPDVIFFNHYLYRDGNTKVAFKNIFTKQKSCKITKKEVIKCFMTGYRIISVCCAIYKRSCIDVENDYCQYGYLNSGEDSIQKLEQFDHAKSYFYLNEALYYYRVGSGMTKKYDPDFFESFEKLFEEIEKRRNSWGLLDFDELMAVKILSTAGRAITQSRFADYPDKNEHIEYLKKIRESKFFERYIRKLNDVKNYLQRDYRFLLFCLKNRWYKFLVILLNVKNKMG